MNCATAVRGYGRVGEGAAPRGLPDAPVEPECLQVHSACRPRDQLDHIVVAEPPFDGRLREAADVYVWFHGVGALPHDQPLIDGGAEPRDAAGEVVLEGA
jgi:hypothetical protein